MGVGVRLEGSWDISGSSSSTVAISSSMAVASLLSPDSAN